MMEKTFKKIFQDILMYEQMINRICGDSEDCVFGKLIPQAHVSSEVR